MVEVNFAFVCHELEVTGGFLTAKGIGFDTVILREIPLRFPPFWQSSVYDLAQGKWGRTK